MLVPTWRETIQNLNSYTVKKIFKCQYAYAILWIKCFYLLLNYNISYYSKRTKTDNKVLKKITKMP